MDATVTHENGHILIAAGYSSDDLDPEPLTPAEARDLARRLNAAAETVDVLTAQSRVACAETGHHWGDPYDAGTRTQPVHVRGCQRYACQAQDATPGWLADYPPMTHRPPYAGPVDCPGPTCPWCASEQLAGQLRQVYTRVTARFDEAMTVGQLHDSLTPGSSTTIGGITFVRPLPPTDDRPEGHQ